MKTSNNCDICCMDCDVFWSIKACDKDCIEQEEFDCKECEHGRRKSNE